MHHHPTCDRSRWPTPYAQVLKPAAFDIYVSRTFWNGMGLWGSEQAFGRERDRSAIEPHARYAPAVAPACPTAPEESDSLLWTLSGGLSPPPVLGAGAARTTSNRCICPPSPPPPSLTHPQPTAPRCARCLTRFCAALRSPCSRFSVPKNTSNMVWRSSSSSTMWSAGHLAGLPVLRRGGAWTAIGPCVHVRHPGTHHSAGIVFVHVDSQMLMYMIVLSVFVVK